MQVKTKEGKNPKEEWCEILYHVRGCYHVRGYYCLISIKSFNKKIGFKLPFENTY